jgi:YQGE family putative transporter
MAAYLGEMIKTGKTRFASLSPPTRRLLLSNFLYNCEFQILPIIANFAIWQQLDDIKFNIIYYLGFFAAHPIGYLLNGYLLNRFRINLLYTVGMVMEMTILISLFLFSITNIQVLLLVGFFMGLATSLYWANRLYMILNSTENQNRDFYLGLETSMGLLAGIISPLVFGFLTGTRGFSLEKLNIGLTAYHGKFLLGIYLFVLIAVSAFNILKGNYHGPRLARRLYFRFYNLWNKQRLLSIIEGFVSGGLLMMPSLVILELIRDSGVLGFLESLGMLLALIPIYLLGGRSKPEYRTLIIFAAGILAFADALLLAVFFNRFSAITFLLGIKILLPLLNMSSMAIRMRSVELASRIEKRSRFSYFIDLEFFFNTGRMLSLITFMLLYTAVSQHVALRYSFLALTLLPILYVFIARVIPQRD